MGTIKWNGHWVASQQDKGNKSPVIVAPIEFQERRHSRPYCSLPTPKETMPRRLLTFVWEGCGVTPREMNSSTKGSDRDIVIGGNSSRICSPLFRILPCPSVTWWRWWCPVSSEWSKPRVVVRDRTTSGATAKVCLMDLFAARKCVHPHHPSFSQGKETKDVIVRSPNGRYTLMLTSLLVYCW